MSLVLETQICQELGIEPSSLREWIEFGLVESVTVDGGIAFEPPQVRRIWSIHSLHFDLDVNLEGVQIVLRLSEQLRQARTAMDRVKAIVAEGDLAKPETREALRQLLDSLPNQEGE